MTEYNQIIKLIKDYEYDTAYDLFVSRADSSMHSFDFLKEVVVNKLLSSDLSLDDEDKNIIKKVILNNEFNDKNFSYFRSSAEDEHYSHLDSLYDDGFTEDYDGPPKDEIKDGQKLIEVFISEIEKTIKEKKSDLNFPKDDQAQISESQRKTLLLHEIGQIEAGNTLRNRNNGITLVEPAVLREKFTATDKKDTNTPK